ncbi:MAG: IPT/TIG domain-containing protein, partial [Candidatus Poribacteria bacterium]|nr:IPT/TIG domain-containing protein [Candidatus Poribacteria bacterium]
MLIALVMTFVTAQYASAQSAVLIARTGDNAAITAGNEVEVGTLIFVETDAPLTASETIGLLNFDGTIITAAAHGLTIVSHPTSGLTGTLDASNNIKTDAQGHFKARFLVPQAIAGAHSVAAGGRSATVLVRPRIVLTEPLQVAFGQTLTVRGDGFAASKEVTISFVTTGSTTHSTDFGKLTSSANGTIDGTIAVGRAPFATFTSFHSVRAADANGNVAVKPSAVAVAPVFVSGPFNDQVVGAQVTIKGHGFPANAVISASVSGQNAIVIGGPSTDANGSLNGTDGVKIQVPAHNYGTRSLVITVGGVSQTLSNALRVVPGGSLKNPALTTELLTGAAGDSVTFAGTGFASLNADGAIVTSGPTQGEKVNLSLVRNGVVVASNIANANAEFSGTTAGNVTIPFQIPALAETGILTVRAQGEKSGAAADVGFFYSRPNQSRQLIAVGANDITISRSSLVAKGTARPNETIGLVGLNYNSTSTSVGNIIIRKGGIEVPITTLLTVPYGTSAAGQITPNTQGVFAVTFAIPAGLEGGTWQIDTTASAAGTGTSITVVPGNLTRSSSTAFVGDTINLTADGYTSAQSITGSIGTSTKSGTASAVNASGVGGAISLAVAIGDQSYGNKDITVGSLTGGDTKVKVLNKITAVDGSSGNVSTVRQKTLGEAVSIAGTGYGATKAIKVVLDTVGPNNSAVDGDDIVLGQTTSGANGSFSVTFSTSNIGLVALGTTYQILVQDTSVDSADRVKVAASLQFIGKDATPIATYTSSRKVGETFTLRGSGLTAGTNLGHLLLDGVAVNLAAPNDTINDADRVLVDTQNDADLNANQIEVSFVVPNLARGNHTISLGGQSVNFTVNSSAFLTVAADEDRDGASAGTQVFIGDTLNVELRGFGAAEAIQLTINDVAAGSTQTSTADKGKKEKVVATVPTGLPFGTYKLKAIGSGTTVEAFDIQVVPSISISPSAGTTATAITVTGQGFARTENVSLTFAGSGVPNGNIVVTDTGTFTKTINVISRAFNRSGYAVGAAGNQSLKSATQTFRIEALLALGDTQSAAFAPGDLVAVRGSGWGDGNGNNEDVKFTIGGVAVTATRAGVGTPTTDGLLPGGLTTNGGFGNNGTGVSDTADLQLTVPNVPGGIQTIQAVGQTSGQVTLVNVNVIPKLTTPGGNTTVGSEVAVTGVGFAKETAVSFRAGNTTISIKKDAATKTDANGTISTTIVMPELPSGAHDIVAFQAGTTNPLNGLQFSATGANKIGIIAKIS